MLKATLKGLLAHKVRMLLTALAVVLGVGFVAGTYVLTDTMNATFDNLFADANRGVDVYVRAENAFASTQGGDQRLPIDDGVLATVSEVDGVAAAYGGVSGYAQIVDPQGEAIAPVGPPTLGISWADRPQNPLNIRDGRPPEDDGEVVIDAATADEAGFQVGDAVKILLQEGAETFELVGITRFGESDNLAGATLAVFDLETAQRVLDKRGKFDAIEIVAEDGISPGQLARDVQLVLPKDVEAATGATVADEQAKVLQDGLGFLNTALLVFAGVALFVGSFIILNTFTIVVAQRTREFALLRALGASGRQVMTSVVIEALIVGVIASAVGIIVGVLIAIGLQSLLSAFGIDLPSTSLQILPRTIIAGMTVGTLVTLVSSVLPARKAARVSPMEALRDTAAPSTRVSRGRVAIGLVVGVAGVTLLFYGLFGNQDSALQLVGGGAFLTLMGTATLSPAFAGPMARVIGGPLPSLLHVPGKLARENASRNPKRTAATASALMIGLALVSFVSVFGSSLKASATELIEDQVRADFTISSAASRTTGQGFTPAVAQELRKLPELESVSSMRFAEFRYEGENRFLNAVDPLTFADVVSLGTDRETQQVADLVDGGVLVYEQAAEDLGIGLGDDIVMNFPTSGRVEQRVDGFYSENEIAGDFLVSIDTYEEHYPMKLDTLVMATIAPGTGAAEARRAVEDALADYSNVTVQDQAEFKEETAAQVDQLLAMVTALLGLALVIALLGITNTLALSVFERTREIGLMRAVGMMRRQTRAMIRWEAVIIAIIGAVLGLVVGTFFGWALVEALRDQGVSTLAIPGGQLAIYVVIAALAGVVAALPPARRAARLNILEAVVTE